MLMVAGLIFGPRISGSTADGYAQVIDFVVAGTGALSGGTISVLIVQEAALGVGLTSIAVFPVLIAALQGLIGFPLTSIILRKEAARLRDEFREGNLESPVVERAGGVELSTACPADDHSGHSLRRGARRPAEHRRQQPDQRRPQHVRGRPRPRHRLAHVGNLQAVGARRHRRLRADDDLDHDPGVRSAGHRRACRREGARLPAAPRLRVRRRRASPASPPSSASSSATACPCPWPSVSHRSSASRAP